MKCIAVLISIIGLVAAVEGGQTVRAADNCEMVSLNLSLVANEHRRSGNADTTVFIIGLYSGRPNAKQTLSMVKQSIEFFGRFYDITDKNIVYGVRPSASKSAEIRYYIDGRYITSIGIERAKRLCFGMGETFDRK